MRTDSCEKGRHFNGPKGISIKRFVRERSCSVVMDPTCFSKLIKYASWCCLSFGIIQ